MININIGKDTESLSLEKDFVKKINLNITESLDNPVIDISSKSKSIELIPSHNYSIIKTNGSNINGFGYVKANGSIISYDNREFLEVTSIADWAKQSTKPQYSAEEIGALPANTFIPAAQVQSDWNQSNIQELDYIKNKPNLSFFAKIDENNTFTGNQSFNNVIIGGDLNVLGTTNVVNTGALQINGVDIATLYQSKNTTLTNIAGLSTSSTGLIKLVNGVATLDSTSYLSSLPIASASVLGGVKAGTGVTIDTNGVISASGGGSTILDNSSKRINSDILLTDGYFNIITTEDLYFLPTLTNNSFYVNGQIIGVAIVADSATISIHNVTDISLNSGDYLLFEANGVFSADKFSKTFIGLYEVYKVISGVKTLIYSTSSSNKYIANDTFRNFATTISINGTTPILYFPKKIFIKYENL